MADVALLGTSVALTIYLPRHSSRLKASLKEISSISVALGLSLTLFSLSILEVLPSSWRVLLKKEGQLDDAAQLRGGLMTVTTMYRLILWGLCIMVIGVLPAVVGSHIMEEAVPRNKADPDAEHKKYPRCAVWRSYSKAWWLQSLWRAATVLMKIINVLIFVPCCLLWQKVKRQSTEPILAMTVKDDEARRPSSPMQKAMSFLVKGEIYRKSYIIGSFCGVVTCFMLLSTLGPQVIDSPRDGGSTHPLATLVSWLCAVGLLLSSILNGFGSVSMPHSYLVGLYLEPIRPDILAKAEDDLAQTKALLDTRRTELSTIASASTDLNANRRRVGPPSRKSFAEFGEEYTKRRKQLYKELDFLDMLCEELEEDVTEMKRAQSLATEARTQAGRIRSCLGIIFSVVLLIRLFAAALSILQIYFPRLPEAENVASQDDPITTSLLWLMGHHFVSQDDYILLSQCISLFLTAILSVSQVRTFLRTTAAINRRINLFFTKFDCKNTRLRESIAIADGDKVMPFGARPGIYTHLLAILMGCYFLSCLVLTKLSLPVAYRSNFSAALGGVEYRIHSIVINATFAVSAIVSAAALGVLFGIQKQSTRSLANSTWMHDKSSATSLDSSSC